MDRVSARPRPIAAAPATEASLAVTLNGGPLLCVVRRSPRARRLRVTVHPDRGVIVSLPTADRHGWARPDATIHDFLSEREAWIRRHLARQEATRSRLSTRPALDAGRVVPYLGEPHRVRIVAAPAGARTTRVSRVGGDDGDELLVERGPRDTRPAATILDAWFRERARAALQVAIERHASILRVTPGRVTIRDTTSRWGSCSRAGALSFSWRLILAPPAALDAVAAHELCHLRVFGHGPRFRALLDARVPEHAAWRRWLRRQAAELHAALD
jgi:predicted metal-dependent hydrolase